MYIFKSKEEILTELVKYVLDLQVFIADELLKDKTNDPILCYALETTL